MLQWKHILTANKRGRSAIAPNNMSVDEIPMFVTITFDDALQIETYQKIQEILNHTNRNNEQIPLVHFISNEYSNYQLIQEQYLQGSEIAAHTVTHSTNIDSTLSKWYHEIKHCRELLSIHTDIAIHEITGFRAPFLTISDKMFQVLNGINPKYSYDSSVISSLNENNLFDWPYTYDNYESDFKYKTGEGPKQSYKGLWEMPMHSLYSDIATKQYFGAMDYVGNYDKLLNSFKLNFLYRLNTNKAPMGLYFHASWLYTKSNVDALNDFIEWVLNMDNTWIVTNKQIINWINNPILNSQYSVSNNNQLMNGKTEFITCYYNGVFWTVLSQCPAENPHSFQYDKSQLIHSNIIITTNQHNILSTEIDVCQNDNLYEIWDSNTIYCSEPTVQNIVRYNDVLYECKWWTKGNDVSTNAVWSKIKDCITTSELFVEGSIDPYGQVDVFLDTVLIINIQPYHGYSIDNISVIINGHYYPIDQIFDYYMFINDKLIIVFPEIKLPEYQIKISFNKVYI